MCQTTPPRRSPSTSAAVTVDAIAGVDGPELVVLRDPLDQPVRLVREHDEVAQEVQETGRVEHAANEHFELRPVRDQLAAIDRLPRRVVLEAGGEASHRGTKSVRDDGHDVRSEDRRNVVAVRLDLVPRTLERRVLVTGVLQFQQPNRQAVAEDDDVGPTVPALLDHRELVDNEPLVALRMLEVDKPREVVTDRAIRRTMLDRNALGHQSMESEVLG